MPRFFYPDTKMIEQSEVFLSEEEARHISRVLRLEVGAEIQLINGLGVVASAILIEITPKKCRALIKQVSIFEKNSQVHVVFGMTKGNALDFILHRCTELGVSSFQPLYSAHSLHAAHFNKERWKKVLIEVAKQCQDPYLPVLLDPLDLKIWLKTRDPRKILIICDENKRTATVCETVQGKEIEILIGPEGGWSKEEQELFSDASFLGLGKNRLRAETAALAATILAKKMLGELAF